MIDILAVGAAASFDAFSDALGARDDAGIALAASGSAALDILSEKRMDLVVIDEALSDMSGLDLARQVAVRYPMTAVALVSPLDQEAFHEATEGLGILAQLPAAPARKDVCVLLETLSRILDMSRRAGEKKP